MKRLYAVIIYSVSRPVFYTAVLTGTPHSHNTSLPIFSHIEESVMKVSISVHFFNLCFAYLLYM